MSNIPPTSPASSKSTDHLQWLGGLLTEYRDQRFYGQVIVYMEAGTIVRVEQLKSMKPPPSWQSPKAIG